MPSKKLLSERPSHKPPPANNFWRRRFWNLMKKCKVISLFQRLIEVRHDNDVLRVRRHYVVFDLIPPDPDYGQKRFEALMNNLRIGMSWQEKFNYVNRILNNATTELNDLLDEKDRLQEGVAAANDPIVRYEGGSPPSPQ